jgi:hypothetical protein
MPKAPGEPAYLYYDGFVLVEEGDYIRTPTGRTYLIRHVRVQARGKHKGRQHLQTTVMAPDHVTEPDAVIHAIAWYPRGPARR